MSEERTPSEATSLVRLDDLLHSDVDPPRPVSTTPAPREQSAVPDTSQERPARGRWRDRVAHWTGVAEVEAPDVTALAESQEDQIAAAHWPRPVNIAVLNLKGGSGKTPTALTLAGVLAHIRGGGVAVLEACETPGTLAHRAEGSAQAGLSELLDRDEAVPNAVALSTYMLRQTSHADVLANSDRQDRVLTARDVITARRVIDHFYAISVTDSALNPASGAWQAAVRTADVAVLPVTFSSDAVNGAARVLELFGKAGPEFAEPEHGLIARTVVVLSDAGIRTSPSHTEAIKTALNALSVPVLEVPFEPALQDGRISIGAFSDASQAAWTAVAAAVVDMCGHADVSTDLVDAGSSAAEAGMGS